MATKPRVQLHASDDEMDLETSGDLALSRVPDAEPEQTDVDRVGALLQLAGNVGRASVKVYRIDQGKSVYCESYSPGEFEDGDFKLIRDSFGPGVYKIMLYGMHPQSQTFGLLTRTEITIAENKFASRPNAQPQNDQMAQVLSAVLDGQRAMMQALGEMRNVAPVDPMANMRQMLEMMSLMRGAMGVDNQREQKSSIGEIIAAVRELKEVAGEIAPGDADTSLMSMLPQVLEIIKQNQGVAQQPIHPVASQYAPVVVPPNLQRENPQPREVQAMPQPQPQHSEQEIERMNIIRQLTGYMEQLIQMARDNAPVSAGADLVYEHLPDEFLGMLGRDDWFTGLCMFNAQAKEYESWFTQVRAEVLAELARDAEGAQVDSADNAPPVEGGQAG